MASISEQLEATSQIERAREALGEALGQAQDIHNTGIDVEQVSASLAKAVKCTFAIQSEGLTAPKSADNIKEAMDHLRQTLMALQDVQNNSPYLAIITSTVARILALLYPVSKVIEKANSNLTLSLSSTVLQNPSSPSAEEAVEPIPLQELKTAPAESPIPLVEESPEPIPLVDEQPIPLTDQKPIALTQKRSSIPAVIPDHERRSFNRRMIEVDIGIQSGTNFFTGFSEDISTGGLFISTFDILSVGTKLNINFNLPPNGPVLSLNGEVRWIREYNDAIPDMEPGMGVQFDGIAQESKKAINAFMAVNPPLFYENE